jgi:hypothetical protein
MKLLLRCCAALALLVPIPIWAAIELGPDTPLIISDKAGTQVLKEPGAPLSPAQALERLAEFGPPRGSTKAGPKEILTYPQGRVVLVLGQVSEMTMAAMPPPASAARAPRARSATTRTWSP